MDEMKGTGQTILRCDAGDARVELVKYLDDSLAVRRDGRTLGVWEPHEVEECFRVLDLQVAIAGRNRAPAAILIGAGVLADPTGPGNTDRTHP